MKSTAEQCKRHQPWRQLGIYYIRRYVINFLCLFTVQKLDLQKASPDETEAVRGQIVISLISRDRGVGSLGSQVTDLSGLTTNLPRDPTELPEG